MNINEFSALFLELIDIIYEFNKGIDRIFNALEYNYTHNIISDLYIEILNQNEIISNEKYEFVVQHIIEFLTNSKEINSSKNDYIYLLSHVISNDIKTKILNQIEQRTIKKQEIFDYKFSENLKILSQLIKNGYFANNNFGEIPYIRKTLKILNEMANDINKEGIYYEDSKKIKNLHSKNELIKRLDIIYLYKNKNLKQIEDKIIGKIKQVDSFINELERAKEYFTTFYPTTYSENINKITDILQKKDKVHLYKYGMIMENF